MDSDDVEQTSGLLAENVAEKSVRRPRQGLLPRCLSRKSICNEDGGRFFSFHNCLRLALLCLLVWFVAASIRIVQRAFSTHSSTTSVEEVQRPTSSMVPVPEHQVEVFQAQDDNGSPFTGAFASIPRMSELAPRQRRMTVIGVWNADQFPTYLRHYLYTMQLNADVLDLLLINRVQTDADPCMDFDQAGINVTWGGNIKTYCMRDDEWKRRHVDFLCSAPHGWNCNATEYDEVTAEYATRPDKKNFNWRPLRGYVFRDLLPNPDNPFWAWMDLDSFAGDFRRYPLNVLSQLSMMTSNKESPLVYMGGQLTAFNLDDPDLASAWKKFPALRTPAHFTKYIDGKMPESSEERYWSYGYMRSDHDLPGSQLSYAFYNDLHGDDYFDGEWSKRNASQTYVISGRDILLVSTAYGRKEIEDLIRLERTEPLDDLGGLGWTGGEDGSSYLVDHPELSSFEAKNRALADVEATTNVSSAHAHAHPGLMEDQVLQVENCSASPHWRVCVAPHPLTETNPPVMRASIVRLKGQQPGHVLRRLEKDQRPRGYERKLLKHHLWAKRQRWYDFPPFDITEDLVLRLNFDSVEVFRMGETRGETLFFREQGSESVG